MMGRRPSDPQAAGTRLQKVLADAGLGSRREVEHWIEQGRIRINGHVAKLGERVSGRDRVELDERALNLPLAETAPLRVIAYHKPEGEMVTRSDPQGRPTVFEHLPKLRSGRWIAVGRLDLNTSGLLLFTTDGELASRMMHPRYGLQREYAVRVLGRATDLVLQELVHGVELEDGPGRFEDIVASGGEGANRWYHVVIREGRQREVRRLWEAVGLRVSRLIRVRVGNVVLREGQRQRHWRELQGDELWQLLQAVGLQERVTHSLEAARSRSQVQPRAVMSPGTGRVGGAGKAKASVRGEPGSKQFARHGPRQKRRP